MKNREKIYIVVIIILLISLSVVIYNHIELEEQIKRSDFRDDFTSRYTDVIVGEYVDSQIKLNGLYAGREPIIILGDGYGSGGVRIYNGFQYTREFQILIESNSTPDFPYDAIDIVHTGPETIGPNKTSGIPFQMKLIEKITEPISGQYTITLLIDGERAGVVNKDLILIPDEYIR